MLTNLLTQLPEGGREIGLGEASLYALIGFLVVFAGIAFLVFIVWLLGKIMKTVSGKTSKKEKKEREVPQTATKIQDVNEEELSEETVAVITAALMAYYQKSNPKCEFTVRRIKRL